LLFWRKDFARFHGEAVSPCARARRQHHVQHDEIMRLAAGFLQRLRAVRRRGDGVTGLFQIELDEFHRLRLVIHN